MFRMLNSDFLDISNIVLFYRVLIFHLKRKLKTKNLKNDPVISIFRDLRSCHVHVVYTFRHRKGPEEAKQWIVVQSLTHV